MPAFIGLAPDLISCAEQACTEKLSDKPRLARCCVYAGFALVASVVKKHIDQFHLTYLKWFKERGYEVHVCAKNNFEDGEKCVIPYCDKFFDLPISRSPFSLSNLTAYFKLKKIIDSGDYELIHCHTPVAAVITRLAAIRFRKKGKKVLYTVHGFHFFKGAPAVSRLYYFVEKFLAPFTDAIITINQEDYEAAEKFIWFTVWVLIRKE